MPTLFEHAGGLERLHRLDAIFYASVLKDPLLQPLFEAGQPQHVDHLTAFTAESFGGPDRFTKELGGMDHLTAVHRHLHITEAQRQRFVELYMAALDAAGMPTDAPFREAFRQHVEFGSQVAMQNSHAESDAELFPLREVPRWNWAGDQPEDQ
jgi:hemoglobin